VGSGGKRARVPGDDPRAAVWRRVPARGSGRAPGEAGAGLRPGEGHWDHVTEG